MFLKLILNVISIIVYNKILLTCTENGVRFQVKPLIKGKITPDKYSTQLKAWLTHFFNLTLNTRLAELILGIYNTPTKKLNLNIFKYIKLKQ